MKKPDNELAAIFPRKQFPTHMPFFDGETLLFCRSEEPLQREFEQSGTLWRRLPREKELQARFQNEPSSVPVSYRAWKLYYCLWADRVPFRLQTGLGLDAIECSPAFYRDGGHVHVSFIGGEITSQRIVYHLYTMSGPSLDELSAARPVSPLEARVGFVSPQYVCLGNRSLLLIERRSGKQFRLTVPFERLYRATFRADDPESLILTGLDCSGQPVTLQFHLEDGTSFQVLSQGPVYKSTLWEDRLIVAVKEDAGFEDRQLKEGSYQLDKLSAQEGVQCTELKDTPFKEALAFLALA